VSGVEQVEAAVREDDALPGGSPRDQDVAQHGGIRGDLVTRHGQRP
jgi:hypothetical protein